MKKVNNFQDEFTIQDIEIARDVVATHDCGMSRIALKAPDQIYKIHRQLMKEPDCASALIHATTLKLYYAIQVWCKAALISARNPSNLLYYWWLHWKTGEGPFNKLEYSNFYKDITVEQLLQWFWELLEQIANSGEIQVFEGYHIQCEGIGHTGPKVICTMVLDGKTGREIDKKVENVYTYPYNKEPRTFNWEDIKDMFYELSLDQLRLTMPDKLHNHTEIDDTLLRACFNWDIDQIKLSIERGANINCLSKNGESVLQNAVEYFKDHGVLSEKNYSEEELKAIESENEQRCKEIVDLLLSYGADINLFGYDGMTPLTCAYYSRSPEMIKFLLERGASPNANCYLEDCQYWPLLKNVRSTILDVIDDLIYEDYGETEKKIETIIREAGGRQYVWDFNPWSYENEGKYVVHMCPSKKDDKLFSDNSGWFIGTSEQITIEDMYANQTVVSLKSIEGLKLWKEDFQNNLTNPQYDWLSWKQRGYVLACKVAKLLPDSVVLFYLYDNSNVVKEVTWHPEHTPEPNELTLCYDGEPIKII